MDDKNSSHEMVGMIADRYKGLEPYREVWALYIFVKTQSKKIFLLL
jgi:hypothetical protein